MLISFQKMRGVTLIELMIAMIILAILLGYGASSFSTWSQNQQIRVGAESILNGMQLARGEAVKRNANTIFVLCGTANVPTNSSWDVLAASPPGTDAACGVGVGVTGWERVQQRSAQEGSRNAVIVPQPAAANNAVGFNGFGRLAVIPAASLGGVAAVLPIVQTITSVDISNPNGGTRPLKITVGAGGNLRMCDPSPNLPAGNPLAC